MIVINFPMLPFNINLAYLFARSGVVVSRLPPPTQNTPLSTPPLLVARRNYQVYGLVAITVACPAKRRKVL